MTDHRSGILLLPAPGNRDHTSPTSRLATPEERLYLRRFNRIRLIRYLMFWAIFAFFGAIFGVLFWLPVLFFIDNDRVGAVIMLGLVLMAVTVYFYMWGRALIGLIRMRPILRVPAQVEVVCFHDHLTTLFHETHSTTNIFMLRARRMLLELPSHWEDMAIERQEQQEWQRDGGKLLSIEVARLSGASGKVLRLPMYGKIQQGSHRRTDATLPDLGDFVLRFGDLSIAQEMRARLPLIRAHDSFLIFTLIITFLALFSTVAHWSLQSDRDEKKAMLAAEISIIVDKYDAGESVPAEGLAARGIEGLRPDAEFGQRVVHAATATFREVALPHNPQIFYLTEAEFSSIIQVSTIFPQNLSGYSTPSARLIAEYRDRLAARIDALGTVMPDIAQKVADLPDAVVAGQLRALSLSNTPDPNFAAALLPQPMIVPNTDVNPFFIRPRVFCQSADSLCGQRVAAVAHDGIIFTAQDGVVVLQQGSDFRHLARRRAELSALNADTRLDRALTVSMAIALLAGAGVLSCWMARGRIREWYFEQAARPRI